MDCDFMSIFNGNLPSFPMTENGEENPVFGKNTPVEHSHLNPKERVDLSNIRLSFVGFQRERTACTSRAGNESEAELENTSDIDLFDEIHSTRFSSVLEETKTQLVEYLPILTEEMISCAIIHAFSDNIEYTDHRGKSLDAPRRCLKNTESWINHRQGSVDKKQAIQFLQESLHTIFLCIRDNDLSAQHAVQIVLEIAAMLGLLEDINLTEDQDHPPGSPEPFSLEKQNDSPRCVMKHTSYHEYRKKLVTRGQRAESH
jgi:hypothetical protein